MSPLIVSGETARFNFERGIIGLAKWRNGVIVASEAHAVGDTVEIADTYARSNIALRRQLGKVAEFTIFEFTTLD